MKNPALQGIFLLHMPNTIFIITKTWM